MLTITYIFDTNIYLYTYMLIYNTTIILLFWTLFNIITSEFKTLHQFNNFSYNSFYVLTISIILFSMAGVPPFIGFFSKLFIILLFINGYFSLFFILLLILLLIGLYFYMKNIKFLHSTNASSANYPFLLNEKLVINYYYLTISSLVIISLGTFFIDDFILFVTWLFN